MAPEILNRSGHDCKADWWALGILTYEMLVGNTPFYTGGSNMVKMLRCIQVKPVVFPDAKRHNIHLSPACKSFILLLLQKDPKLRLGAHGDVEEILAHPWLVDIDPAKILKKEIEAPIIPEPRSPELSELNLK